MAGRKLGNTEKERLRKLLTQKLKGKAGKPILDILQDIGSRFGITAEAVRYYAKAMLGRRAFAKRGRPKGSRTRNPSLNRTPHNGANRTEMVRHLIQEAKKHRNLARTLSKHHERLARKFELAARSLGS